MTTTREINATFRCGRCAGRGVVLVGRHTPLTHMERCTTCRGRGHMLPIRREPRGRLIAR